MEGGAEEEEDEEGDAEDGGGGFDEGKVGSVDAGVEAEDGAGPEEEDGGSLPQDEVGNAEGEGGETEEEEEVEGAPEGEGDGGRHEDGEVFGPAFDHGGGGRVHAGGQGVGGVAEADVAFAAALNVAGEGDVFEDFAADGSVAADGEVGVALDQQELAVGGGDAAAGVVDFGRGVNARQLGEDEGHDEELGDAGGDLAGGVGEERCVVLLGFAEGAGEVAWVVKGVGVGEEEVGSASELGTGPAGVVFSGKAGGGGVRVERGGVEEGDAGGVRFPFGGRHGGVLGGGLSGDVAGAVGGGVIDQNQLPLAAEGEAGFGLGEEGFEAGGEVGFFVAGGEDDGELEEGRVVFGGGGDGLWGGWGRGMEVGDLLLGEEAEDGFAGAVWALV